MVIIENQKIGQIPILHVAQKEKWDERLPLVIFVHGFTSAKEHNLHFAYLLAEKGYRTILPDAQFHGERDNGLRGNDLNMQFWEIVLNTLRELNILKKSLEDQALIDPERIGVIGTSMGGIVTLGALTQYKWIKTAISLMGNPTHTKFALSHIAVAKEHGVAIHEEEISQLLHSLRQIDLSIQPEKLANRPLLFWHGKKDAVVPYAPTYDFYESIRSLYADTPDKLRFISEEKAGHKVNRAALLESVEWFETYL